MKMKSPRFKILLLLGMPFLVTPYAVEAIPSQQALELVKQRKYAQALPLMEQKTRVSPNDSSAHYYLGVCLHALNRLDRAEQEYKWVIYRSKHADLKVKATKNLASLEQYRAKYASALRAREAAAASAKKPERKSVDTAAKKEVQEAPPQEPIQKPGKNDSQEKTDNQPVDTDSAKAGDRLQKVNSGEPEVDSDSGKDDASPAQN